LVALTGAGSNSVADWLGAVDALRLSLRAA